tara:strand:+ start:723 stop:1133 length:411 start_codon:yes stop_codon:yes gene_type:complete
MKHSLHASLSFDYQGKSFALQSLINIKNIVTHEDFYRSVYLQLAQEHNIDQYSYQLEVMMDQNIHFSDAKGCAEGCIDNQSLNLDLLRKNYEQVLCLERIEIVSLKYLNSSEMTQSVKQALIEAYQLGKTSSQNPV